MNIFQYIAAIVGILVIYIVLCIMGPCVLLDENRKRNGHDWREDSMVIQIIVFIWALVYITKGWVAV